MEQAEATSPSSFNNWYNLVVKVAALAVLPVNELGICAIVPAVQIKAADSPTIRPILKIIATSIPGKAFGVQS